MRVAVAAGNFAAQKRAAWLAPDSASVGRSRSHIGIASLPWITASLHIIRLVCVSVVSFPKITVTTTIISEKEDFVGLPTSGELSVPIF